MKEKKIYIAGHLGMVGSAIKRKLEDLGYHNFIFRSSSELDLRDQSQVKEFFRQEKPAIVIDAAAKVGGIMANNNYPYQFLMDNMQIQNNLIHESLENKVEKFIFLGSSCIYPKFADQPLKESSLLTDSLEPTNEWYALAKITGVKACQAIRNQFGKDYVSLMPTNLYGTHDNFDLTSSHVLPAMIRKFHEAKIKGNTKVTLWGSGNPMREFLFVDDLAKAVVFALENKLPDYLYNIGTGVDLSIKDLAHLIQSIVGHQGDIIWDSSKPDGTPRKLMDVSKMHALGWRHQIELKEGIEITYQWFLKNQNNYKEVKL
ncbi:GDP-L-fucose synthase family protein [Sphingobacterium faecium]|jgi:GDP-L-fucose synthase|uniref:GDP-L-fucose synthase family protein n=1 Tax=Sphingobacterium faecium TaxID=34087 RepID=UPI00097E90AC|nr:GDP-L-fucose synthase [Sphingobacterium faecium]SJN51133.1 GDP-L-fucose synthetase [Sphingobacterium faecium PCAi_F2.5]PTX12651.1 GDP-L-fucose synthase [Sphingobacterium faecium]UXD69487.1 GDP-L-fucose synthase [Sphingobacterium faecium]WGQ13032.1 GDP-L-fucose synthase [Sphingobacterium faecium]GEM62355.1 GDP-L-fucose synthase [Sphingobacterium faecium NBRC 15299]